MKKHKKTPSAVRDEIAEIVCRVQAYRPSRGDFNYARCGQAVTEAHRLYNESFSLMRQYPMNTDLVNAYSQSVSFWHEAQAAAYPPGFRAAFEQLQAGDRAGLESALLFLEADPYFFGTGYLRTHLSRYIKPPMLSSSDTTRIQKIIVAAVETRHDRDFGAFYRLAKKVDAPELRAQLERRLTHDDTDVRRRARWVLEALAQKDSMEAAKKAHNKE